MRSKVQTWGNSLAVRIPRAFALELGLQHDVPVDVSIQAGVVVVTPVKQRIYTLDELLAAVSARNKHTEVDFGGPVGNEAW